MRRTTMFAIGAAAFVSLAATGSTVFNRQVVQTSVIRSRPPIEGFDGVMPPALPAGWVATNAIDPDGVSRVTSNSGDPSPPADSPPDAAFVNNPSAISDKRLDSPSIFLSQGPEIVQIGFRNNFDLQDGFDGGVLEISIDGGETFQDILTFGTVVTGGYNGTVSGCCGNPLAGRQAWTGNSAGFITTTVNLGATFGPSMMLRWRMGSDVSGSGQGWRIDTVDITQCHKATRPPTAHHIQHRHLANTASIIKTYPDSKVSPNATAASDSALIVAAGIRHHYRTCQVAMFSDKLPSIEAEIDCKMQCNSS